MNSDMNRHSADDADRFSGDHEGTFWQKWFGGGFVPAALVILACRIWMTGKAILPGHRGSSLPLEGPEAVAEGFLLFSIAWFLFFHYFMVGTQYYNLRMIGKIAGVLGAIGSLGYIGLKTALS